MAMTSTSFTRSASSSCFRKASAGGQLEQPSEVNNSRTTGRGWEPSEGMAATGAWQMRGSAVPRKAIKTAANQNVNFTGTPLHYNNETARIGKGVQESKKM